MSRQKEKEFASWFKNEYLRLKPHRFYYKIPDTPGHIRFKPTKPFDAMTCARGTMVAIEFKYNDKLQSIGMHDLRPSQIEGLETVENSGGLAYVVWEMKLSRGKYGVFFAHFRDVQTQKSWLKKDIENGNAYRTGLEYISMLKKARCYDLAEWVMDVDLSIGAM